MSKDEDELNEGLQAFLHDVEEMVYLSDIITLVDLMDENRKRFQSGPPILWVEYLLKSGWVNIRRRRLGEAEESYNEALKIIDENPKDDPEWKRLKQEYLWGMGRLKRFSGDVDGAISTLEEGIALREWDDATCARPHLDLAPLLAEKGEMNEALDHYRSGINILEKTDAKNELARAYNNISDAFIKTGNYEDGLEFATKCIRLSGEIGNTRVAGFGAMNGGEALVRMGDAVQAMEYYEICNEAWKDTKEDYERGSVFMLLGMVETLAGNYTAAQEAFEEANHFMEEQDRRFYAARTKHEYGILLTKMGEKERARVMFQEAIAILEEFNWEKELDAVKEKLDELDE